MNALAQMANRDLALDLAAFTEELTFDDVPEPTRARLTAAVLDTVGAALAARDADGIPETLAVVEELGGAGGDVTLLGSRRGVSLQGAIVANTAMARALELDDVHEQALMHPSMASVPNGLALAEWLGGVDGRDFIAALAAGMEIACRLGLTVTYDSFGPAQRPRMFSFTYQCATFGAAITAAKLLGLGREGVLDALGNAYSQVAGVQQVLEEYALVVRSQQGLSAWGGTAAALLARRGVTGPHEPFEGRFGWFNAYFGGAYDRDTATRDLGSRWEVDRISVKPYPVCKVGHPAVLATARLVVEHDLAAADIAGIAVRVPSREAWDRMCFPIEVKQAASDPVAAQFSLPFAIAAMAVRRRLGLAEMNGGFDDPEIRDLMGRVVPELVEPDGGGGRMMPMPFEVAIELRDGTVHATTVQYPHGHPENPMSRDDVVAKFEECARFGFPNAGDAALGGIADTIASLAELDDVAAIPVATRALDDVRTD